MSFPLVFEIKFVQSFSNLVRESTELVVEELVVEEDVDRDLVFAERDEKVEIRILGVGTGVTYASIAHKLKNNTHSRIAK